MLWRVLNFQVSEFVILWIIFRVISPFVDIMPQRMHFSSMWNESIHFKNLTITMSFFICKCLLDLFSQTLTCTHHTHWKLYRPTCIQTNMYCSMNQPTHEIILYSSFIGNKCFSFSALCCNSYNIGLKLCCESFSDANFIVPCWPFFSLVF